MSDWSTGNSRSATATVIATPAADWAAIAPYLVPILVFGGMTALEGPLANYYVFVYAAKIAAVTAALFIWRGPLADIRPSWRGVLPSVVLGLALFVLWIGFGNLLPYSYFGTRTGYDPFELGSGLEVGVFLAVRFYGLVLLVPVVEELFWRSFLLRYFTSQTFRSVPIGTYSSSALLIMVVASAVAHPEWLAAAATSLAFAVWLRRTRSLFTVVVAHATTNAALGVYVLATGDWMYW